MSEQPTALHDDLSNLLNEAGPDAYALTYVSPEADPVAGPTARPPGAGLTGVTLPGARPARVAVDEVGRGMWETLRRWLQRDDGRRQLAIFGTDYRGELREYTPGELAANLLGDPSTDQAEFTHLLSSWLHRRSAEAPLEELGWVTAAAAWASHMRAFTPTPPPPVLSRSLASGGEVDEAGSVDAATEDLVTSTGRRVAELLDRLEYVHRPRNELAEDWRAMESLSGDLPQLKESADWLLDQISLRDAHAQQLRAVLEPDITDHLRDRQADDHLQGIGAPVLDEARTAHLAQARETVRAYTAAAYSGREQEAQHLLDAFPIPVRALEISGPAAAWRRNSATAQYGVDALAEQRAAITAEDSTDLFADPELLHAETSYLAAREGQLHLIHDALGRLAYPAPAPHDLPEGLGQVAAAQTQRRVIEAFGTVDRAREALHGQLSYQRQQPAPTHRRATTGAETDLLSTAIDALEHTSAAIPLDAERIRARTQEVMTRPAALAGTAPTPPTAHDEAHTQALTAGSTTPTVHR
jgi:hypothetical protein